MDCNHNCGSCKFVFNGGCIHSPIKSKEYKLKTLLLNDNLTGESSPNVILMTNSEMLTWSKQMQGGENNENNH